MFLSCVISLPYCLYFPYSWYLEGASIELYKRTLLWALDTISILLNQMHYCQVKGGLALLFNILPARDTKHIVIQKYNVVSSSKLLMQSFGGSTAYILFQWQYQFHLLFKLGNLKIKIALE